MLTGWEGFFVGLVLVVFLRWMHNQQKKTYTESHLTIFYSQSRINWILQTLINNLYEGAEWERAEEEISGLQNTTERQEMFNLLREGTLGGCVQAQRLLWAGSQGNLTKHQGTAPICSTQELETLISTDRKVTVKTVILVPHQAKEFSGSHFFFLLNNWPLFRRKTNQPLQAGHPWKISRQLTLF